MNLLKPTPYLIILLLLLLPVSKSLAQNNASKTKYLKGYTVLKEGQDLEPYINQNVQVIATVSNTKHPSINNYWLTVLELEDARNKKVHVWGKLIKKQESSTLPDGTIVQGRDGTYYHLINTKYKIIE